MRKSSLVMLSILIVASLLLSACTVPAAAPGAAPEAATEAVAEDAAPAAADGDLLGGDGARQHRAGPRGPGRTSGEFRGAQRRGQGGVDAGDAAGPAGAALGAGDPDPGLLAGVKGPSLSRVKMGAMP